MSPWRNRATAGHHDPVAAGRDLDFEGVAAEVIFHGSQNDEPVPFQTSMLGPPDDAELAAAGIRIYNRWLAAVCADAPDRHVGLAQLPIWDVDASVEELRWAHAAGLKGVNFPAPRPWVRAYNDRAWEPFWAAAAETRMPLSTHSGGGDAACADRARSSWRSCRSRAAAGSAGGPRTSSSLPACSSATPTSSSC